MLSSEKENNYSNSNNVIMASISWFSVGTNFLGSEPFYLFIYFGNAQNGSELDSRTRKAPISVGGRGTFLWGCRTVDSVDE